MENEGNGSRLLSAEELAAFLGLPLQSVWRAARLNRIPSYRCGARLFFDRAEVLAAMRQEKSETSVGKP